MKNLISNPNAWLSVVTMFLLFSTACGSKSQTSEGNKTDQNTAAEEATEKYPLVTKKVKDVYQIDVPEFMTEMKDLNERASLSYGNSEKQVFIVVIDWDKEKDQLTESLDEYYKVALEELSGAISEPNSPDPAQIKSNGMEVRRGELTGLFNDIPIFYYLNIVETKTHIYEMVMWTAQEDIDEYKPMMDAIYDSFKELK